MFKSVGILVGGIFVGALGVELVRRKYPGAADKLYARAREATSQGSKVLGKLCTKTGEMASQAIEAFKKGYQSAAQPQESPPAPQPSA